VAEDLVEGWTEPIEHELLADGDVPGGSGKSVTLQLIDRNGFEVEIAGDVDWIDETAGTVRYTPDAGDLRASGSPYAARWKVTSSGESAFFPNGKADVWTVRR
jgi:hypothetical protein